MNIETDNRGKPLQVWRLGDYELCENVNLGLEGGWVFELTRRSSRVDLYPTLKRGKQGAVDHARKMAGSAEPLEAEGEL